VKVKYFTKDKRLGAELEGNSQKEIFKGLAKFQEIFDSEPCGACGADDTFYSVRTVDNNDYYEKKCRKCGAALSYGQTKDGISLFPKRKATDGSWDNVAKGWHKWQPKD